MKIKLELLVVALLLVNIITGNAQSMKKADNGLFSFTYPARFKNAPIINAPHALFKIEDKEYQIIASAWDKGYEPGTDICSDYFYNIVGNMPIPNGKVLCVNRKLLQTEGGKVKCLRAVSELNQRLSTSGEIYRTTMISYLFIKDKYLCTFTFLPLSNFHSKDTLVCDKLMTGLEVKSSNYQMETEDEFENGIIEQINIINKQLPIKVDECTTYTNLLLVGKTIIVKGVINNSCEGLIDFELFKERMILNYTRMLPLSFFKHIEKYGYTMCYQIYNENQLLLRLIEISPREIIGQYDRLNKE